MLSTRIRQKDGIFYFVSFKPPDVLSRGRFTSRFYFEGETLEAEADVDDPIAKFIGSVERSEKAFQRLLSRRKVREIVNFYESAETQPAIPGSILLFSEDVLKFKPLGQFQSVGDLEDPKSGFLIIDGQHRLAGLQFYGARNPGLLDHIEVPCVIFEGKPERVFELVADYLKAVRSVMEKIWGANDRYKFTTSVTIKALIRALGDILEQYAVIENWRDNPSPKVFERLIAGWANLKDE